MIVYSLHNVSISLSISAFIIFDPFGIGFGLNKILFIILSSIFLKFWSLFGLIILVLYLFKKPSYLSFSIPIDASWLPNNFFINVSFILFKLSKLFLFLTRTELINIL